MDKKAPADPIVGGREEHEVPSLRHLNRNPEIEPSMNQARTVRCFIIVPIPDQFNHLLSPFNPNIRRNAS